MNPVPAPRAAPGDRELEVPLRILHLTKRFPRAAGGDATVVARLRDEQRTRGHHVTVVTSRSAGIDPAHDVHRVGLELAPEQLDSIGPRRLVSLAVLAGWALLALPRLRPDVLHVHSVDMGAALAPAAALHRVPRVITLHGTSIGDARFSRRRRLVEAALVRVAGYRRVTSVDATVVPALPHGALGAPSFLPNPVDAPAADRGPEGRRGILFVGRLEDVKGVDVLLEALAVVVREVPWAHLTLVGGGSAEAELRAQADAAGLGTHVRFTGPTDRNDVLALMDRAGVLAVPSRYEGLPMVLLESWAGGLPVVATAVGSIPVVATDGVDALVVPREDPAALAAALVRVLRDDALAARLAENGVRTAARSFRPDHVHREVLALYRSSLPLRPRPRPRGPRPSSCLPARGIPRPAVAGPTPGPATP